MAFNMEASPTYGFASRIPSYTNDRKLTIKLIASDWKFNYMITPTPGLGVTRRSHVKGDLDYLVRSVQQVCTVLNLFTAAVQKTSTSGQRLPGSGHDRLTQDRIIASVTGTSQDLLAICEDAARLTLEVCDTGNAYRHPHPTEDKDIRAMEKMAERDATLAAFLDSIERFHHQVDGVFGYAATALQRTRVQKAKADLERSLNRMSEALAPLDWVYRIILRRV